MQINFCKNHREEIAHFRCFYCKQSICAKCRYNLNHHYFCSYRCYYFYLVDGLSSHFKLRWKEWLLLFQFITILVLVAGLHRQENKLSLLDKQLFELHQILDTLAARPSGELSDTLLLNFSSNLQGRQLTLGFPATPGSTILTWVNGKVATPNTKIKADSIFISLKLPQANNSVAAIAVSPAQKIISRYNRVISFPEKTTGKRLTISRGPTSQKALALTFDGGSDSRHTEEILRILRENQLQCTLFLTGKFIQQNPQLVRKMLADGHEIGNHTYSHPHLTTYALNRRHDLRPGVDSLFVISQLLKTDSIFFAISGRHLMPYWRAPYGEYNNDILKWAAKAGYIHIRWSQGFDTYDWVTDESSRLFRTPEEIFTHFQTQNQKQQFGLNGVIVLMHLGSQRNGNHVYLALPKLIPYLKREGYKLHKISQLLQITS